MDQAAARRPNARAPLAAFFSFVLPGLGQAYNRQFRLALLLGLPAAVLGWLVVAAAGRGGEAVAALLDVRVLVAIVLLNLGLLGWRAVAIYQAHVARETPGLRRWTTWITAALLLATLGMHLVPAWYVTATIETLNVVSLGGGGGGGLLQAPPDLPEPRPNRTAPPAPYQEPEPTPVGLSGRFTVLLVGVDVGPGRRTYNTDTMIVATLDPRSGASLISIPRDTFGTPMGDGRVYNAKLNSLLAYARLDPSTYPLGGPETLKAAVGALLGMKSTTSRRLTSWGSPVRWMQWEGWMSQSSARSTTTAIPTSTTTSSAFTSRQGPTIWTAIPRWPSPDRARAPATTTSPGPTGSSV